jgi:hypothetical protein
MQSGSLGRPQKECSTLIRGQEEYLPQRPGLLFSGFRVRIGPELGNGENEVGSIHSDSLQRPSSRLLPVVRRK